MPVVTISWTILMQPRCNVHTLQQAEKIIATDFQLTSRDYLEWILKYANNGCFVLNILPGTKAPLLYVIKLIYSLQIAST